MSEAPQATVTVHRAAALLRVGVPTLRAAKRDGFLAGCYGPRGELLFALSDLEKVPRCKHDECDRVTFGATGHCRQHGPKLRIGEKASPETRAAMSAARTGKKLSAAHRAAIGSALRGRPKSAEHRAKIGQAHRGKKLGGAPRSDRRRGARRTEATRARRAGEREALRGKPKSPEHVDNMRRYPVVERVCANPTCAASMRVDGWKLRLGMGRYCSKACLGKANGERQRKYAQEERWCEQCGESLGLVAGCVLRARPVRLLLVRLHRGGQRRQD